MDERNRVLYVGKAKNLRSRLSSYFGNFDRLHERTQRMLQAATDVKWTIVNTEYDALQLEFSWIKQYEPPFNIRFRDDKSYPYIAISMAEEVPRAFITRNRELPGVKYFGPYTQSWAVRETLDTLLKVFPVRSCSQGILTEPPEQRGPVFSPTLVNAAPRVSGELRRPRTSRLQSSSVASSPQGTNPT